MTITTPKAIIILAVFTVTMGFAISRIGSGERTVTAAAPPAITSTPEQAARGAECKAVLRKANIYHYSWSDGYATVEVGDAFYNSPFKQKVELNALVRCVATEGRMDQSLSIVDYVDWRSHQSVGRWDVYSGELKVTR